jgi:cytochrome b561
MQITGYSRSQIALHWGIAALLLVSFFSHEAMKSAFRGFERGLAEATAGLGAQIHVGAGLAILTLVLIRLAVRLRRGVPRVSAAGGAVQAGAARAVHWLLYGLLVLIPASGAVAWFVVQPTAGTAHELLVTGLWLLAGLHSLAALFHHYVLKDGLIGRMLRAG